MKRTREDIDDGACMASDVYTHGHHESVLRSHLWRTAENSAAYLLPSLRSGLDLLDVGCGPGTITVDLARLVAPGRTIGIDREADVLVKAREHAAREKQPVEFRAADLYRLEFADASFDVVHAHQVLQHLRDPVRALVELRRVVKPGGVLAARDSTYSCFAWAPRDRQLERWLAVYREVARANHAEPDAGPYLKGWALSAGFTNVVATSSTWTYADTESCASGASIRRSRGRQWTMALRRRRSFPASRKVGVRGRAGPTRSSPCCTARFSRVAERSWKLFWVQNRVCWRSRTVVDSIPTVP